jgi:uncharacterized damage-inducible protein DinB
MQKLKHRTNAFIMSNPLSFFNLEFDSPVMENIFYKEFIDQSLYYINENTSKIKICMKQLDEKDIWFRRNEHINSIGNIILHLCGNIRQYIISSLGGDPDIRERDIEFSTTGGFTNAELTAKLQDTIEEANAIIANASPDNLLLRRVVQGTTYSGIGVIIHVTEHYSYHTGQIIFLTKLLKNMDMGFYTGVDLNQRNVPV